MSGNNSNCWLVSSLAIIIIIILSTTTSQAARLRNNENGNGLKTATFLSPKIESEPGLASNKYYFNIDFPKGHIAIKEFDSELVDEAGNSVPLHETYLHHLVVERFYLSKNSSRYIVVSNSGVCEVFPQYFGLGSETRKTDNHIPNPYGIEAGNPGDTPEGYEEGWMLNVHAIDTRGVEDKLGCTECRCGLYNLTEDEFGQAIEQDYIGGLRCCYDQKRCRVKQGYNGPKRSLYLKYTVKYVDWDSSIVPVKIYILDVTDPWKKSDDHHHTKGLKKYRHPCMVEYYVESCSADVAKDKCVHTQTASVVLPSGGDLIYGLAHQHTGGIGSAIYGEDGRTLCSSFPIYGEGNEPGNEAGYIVGMTTCYPQPGSVKIFEGEMITIESNYSNTQSHTGVMGIFYILVAEPLKKSNSILHAQHDETLFKPTDKELMQYLEAFVLEKPLDKTFEFFAVEDLYGGKEPWQIFDKGFGGSIRYYFTELRRKCENGSRFLRGVGESGTWKGQDKGKPVWDQTKQVMGFKKSLRYETKRTRSGDERGIWLMKEYSLSDDYLRGKNVVYKDVVLCRIKKVSKKTSRNQSVQKIHEDETLGVYEWPQKEVANNNTLLSPPPLEHYPITTMDEEVSNIIGVDHGTTTQGDNNNATTMDDLGEDIRILLMSTPPPQDIYISLDDLF